MKESLSVSSSLLLASSQQMEQASTFLLAMAVVLGSTLSKHSSIMNAGLVCHLNDL